MLLRFALIVGLVLGILPIANAPRLAGAAVPNLYEKKATWAETMLASRAALKVYEDAKGFKPFISDLTRSGQPPQHISVDVRGVETLLLVADDGGDGPASDHAIWGEAKLIASDGSETLLDALKPIDVKVGWDKLRRGETYNGTPLRIADKTFKSGLWAHAPSELRYRIDGEYERFEAWVGISHLEPTGGSVRFMVLDGVDPAPDLWARIAADFPDECERMAFDAPEGKYLAWLRGSGNTDIEREMIRQAAEPVGIAAQDIRERLTQLDRTAVTPSDTSWLRLYEEATALRVRWREARSLMRQAHPAFASVCERGALRLSAPRRAWNELEQQNIAALPDADAIGKQLDECEKALRSIEAETIDGQTARLPEVATQVEKILDLTSRISVARGWPTAQGDTRRSAVTGERLRFPLAERWSLRSSLEPQPAWPPPAKANLAVSVRQLADPVTFDRAFHPIASGSRLYFGSSADDAVYCVDATSGSVLWSFVTEGPVRLAPALAGGRIFVGSDDGYLYALEANTGSLLWKYRAGPDERRLPGNMRMISLWPVRCGIAVEGGVVYFGAGVFPDHGAYLCALSARTGKEVWKQAIDASPQGNLLCSPRRLFVPTGRTPFVAFDRATGKALGAFGQNSSWGEDQVGGTFAIVADDTLTAFQSEDGRINTFNTQNRERIVTTHGLRIAIDGPMAFTLAEKSLSALDRAEYMELLPRLGAITAVEADKRSDWQKRQLAELEARRRACVKWEVLCDAPYDMVIAGQALLAGGDGEVVAYDTVSGEILWRTACEGKAYGMAVCGGRLFISTDKGMLYCYDPEAQGAPSRLALTPPEAGAPTTPQGPANTAAQQAAQALKAADTNKGYCLVLGSEAGELVEEIAKQSEMSVLHRLDDGQRVNALRKRFWQENLYGARIAVHAGSSEALPYPTYFANLIVARLAEGETPPTPANELFRILRPCGGTLCLYEKGEGKADVRAWAKGAIEDWSTETDATGTWWIARRGALEGAGEWTHLYAEPGNSSCSGDVFASGPMDLQWFGPPGPRTMADRHHHNVPPLSKDGRVFIPGDNVIYGADAYNGTLLWRVEIPHSMRLGAFLDCGSMALDSARLHVAVANRCVALDVRTGERVAQYEVPLDAMDWGYVARSGDLLFGSACAPGASYGDISLRGGGRFYGNAMQVVSSRGLFAFDAKTGEKRWEYPTAVVPNATIAMGDGKVFFVESTSPKAIADTDGRMTMADMLDGGKQVLVSLDAESGEVVYKREIDMGEIEQPTFLNCADGALLLSGSKGIAPTVHYYYQVFEAASGDLRWKADHDSGLPDNGGHGEYNRHPTIVGGIAYAWPYAYELRTGKRLDEWKMDRHGHGCGGVSASASSLFWRGSNPWMCDLGGSGQFRRMTAVTRPGCWINIIPAGGLVLIPEASSGCTCGYSIQTSLAMAPRPGTN